MKKLIVSMLAATVLAGLVSCGENFLDQNPQGELDEDAITSQDGVEGLLLGAYSLLNGNVDGTWGNYSSGPSQWLFGEVASDNAHKGSEPGDQPNMTAIEQHRPNSTNDNLGVLWTRCFEGVIRCNKTLEILARVQNGEEPFEESRAMEIQAEARFLRGHYYFLLRRVYLNVPYVDENTEDKNVPNDQDIYPQIEADFRFAAENLTTEKPNGEAGRADQIAAKAYLGKVLLYQHKYEEALPLFQDVIDSRPDLTILPFTDNFDITRENGPESIFAVQHGVNDGTAGENGNVGDMLNFPMGSGSPASCCGFFRPSVDLASAYQVDAGGLPLFDTYRETPVRSDLGLSGEAKRNYEPDPNLRIDPRMDYTLGRRGVPYRDWGPFRGDPWIRGGDYAGPYMSYKNTIERAQVSSETAPGLNHVTGLNINIIRLADVYLMAAECHVEQGNLDAARMLVNSVRERASSTLEPKEVNGQPVADYQVGLYPSFPDVNYAREAVRWERRLELALEGHRFFDLVRWGVTKEVMDSYYQFESGQLPADTEGNNYLQGITIRPQDEYFPIPQDQIDRSDGVLKQNEGY